MTSEHVTGPNGIYFKKKKKKGENESVKKNPAMCSKG